MVDPSNYPVAWSQLMYQSTDAHEHLGDLIARLTASGPQSDEEFSVNLGHVYAHLNRAWHLRNQSAELTDEQWAQFSAFPSDVTPVG